MVAKKKSTTTRKVLTKSRAKNKEVTYESFKVASDANVFFTPRVTKQTLYWSILLLFIILMQMAIIAININATLTLDSIQPL
ncbi:hypothetical protein BH10PAT4_BH10PAT4_0180 [soil metagenome]